MLLTATGQHQVLAQCLLFVLLRISQTPREMGRKKRGLEEVSSKADFILGALEHRRYHSHHPAVICRWDGITGRYHLPKDEEK